MTDLIQKSQVIQKADFILIIITELSDTIKKLEQEKRQKTILFGVTYALIGFGRTSISSEPKTTLIVMETGGMKGKRKEALKEEIYEILKDSFCD